VLADLHASAVNQSPFIARIIDLTLAEKPDLIVLPGDIIDGRVDKRMEDIEPLKKLSAPYGVYAAPGNHEYYSGYEEWLAKFAELKLPILINANVEIKKDGKSIYVGGIADHAAYRHKKELPDLQKTWQNVPADDFKRLLSHQPKNLRKNARSGVALQISGHTHGGMIIGMDKLLIAPSNEGVVCGEYDIDGMKLYISAGASLWSGFPLRLGIPPEISIIRLFRK
jgi:predicted MPP superfamily phosphohydrolase